MFKGIWAGLLILLASCNGTLLLNDGEVCDDLQDNDGDGLTDCLDSDCAEACIEDCADGADNDQDGAVDCDDTDCAGDCIEVCDDQLDNDQDGKIDCDDGACDHDPVCDTGAVLFDPSVLHTVELTVDPQILPQLVPDTNPFDNIEPPRVPANLVFDGTAVAQVGIRIKGFIGSVDDLNGKPGFSIKIDEFVEGQNLFGVNKLTVDNAKQDPTFVSEHVGYEIWRRAGIPAQRTSYARLTFNGTYFGVYVVNESVNANFLRRNFDDGSGNLYEGIFHVDVTDFSTIDIDTNEEANDRSDLEALANIILNVPDDQFMAAVSTVLNVDEFMHYWAIEALTYHWDGYAQLGTFGCCSPNNYYVYHEPTLDQIFFMPHGIDQLFQDVNVNVFLAPDPESSLTSRLANIPEARVLYVQAIRDVLGSAWDTNALIQRIDAAETLITPSVQEFDRHFGVGFTPPFQNVRDYLTQRPQIVLDQLTAAGF